MHVTANVRKPVTLTLTCLMWRLHRPGVTRPYAELCKTSKEIVKELKKIFFVI